MEDLLERLWDPAYAAEYVVAVLKEGDTPESFLLALRDIAEAQGNARDVNVRTDKAIYHRLLMLDRLAVFPKVLYPLSRHRDESSASRLIVLLNEASFVGVFPYRETWARRPPSFDNLGIRRRVSTDPFKQVEDQKVYRV